MVNWREKMKERKKYAVKVTLPEDLYNLVMEIVNVEYDSPAEYLRELIRNDLRRRGKLG